MVQYLVWMWLFDCISLWAKMAKKRQHSFPSGKGRNKSPGKSPKHSYSEIPLYKHCKKTSTLGVGQFLELAMILLSVWFTASIFSWNMLWKVSFIYWWERCCFASSSLILDYFKAQLSVSGIFKSGLNFLSTNTNPCKNQ